MYVYQNNNYSRIYIHRYTYNIKRNVSKKRYFSATEKQIYAKLFI